MSGSYELQQVSSFNKFACLHKSKLTTQYPFLSSEQINGKLKDMWKKLDSEQRNKYTKMTVKLTPDKCTKKRASNKGTRDRRSKEHKTSGNKKDIFNVSNTPEYVNTEKLHDFRKQHAVNYENDFNMDGSPFKSMSPTWCASYEKKFRENQQSAVPNVFDETPTKEKGILKSRSSNKKSDRVSFAGQPSYNFRDDSDTDDDTGVLIKRNSEDNFCNDVVMATDDSDDDAGILITREDIHKDGAEGKAISNVSEDFETQTQEDETELNGYTKDKEDVVGKDRVETDCNNNSTEAMEENHEHKITAQPEKVAKKSARVNRKRKACVDTVTGDNNQEEDMMFKSPNPKKSLRRSQRKNQLTPNPGSDAVERSSTLPQTTPVLPMNKTEPVKYTTPQMDEVLQKLTLNEANKAPQKRRQNKESADASERLKAVTSGRRATRSLMAMQSSSVEHDSSSVNDNTNTGNDTDMKETVQNVSADTDHMETEAFKATKDNVNFNAKGRKKSGSKMGNQKTTGKVAKPKNSCLQLDPSGDASQSVVMDSNDVDVCYGDLCPCRLVKPIPGGIDTMAIAMANDTGASDFRGDIVRKAKKTSFEQDKDSQLYAGNDKAASQTAVMDSTDVDVCYGDLCPCRLYKPIPGGIDSGASDFRGDIVRKVKRKSLKQDKDSLLYAGNDKSPDQPLLNDQDTHRKPSTMSDSTTDSDMYSQITTSSDDLLSLPDTQDLHVTPASMASSLSSLRSIRRLCKQPDVLNSRLEKVLEGLQMTGLASNVNWDNSNSDGSSPRLLSPALSGISELSSGSGSSQSTTSYSSVKQYDHFNTNVQVRDQGEQRESGGVLFDMFEPATPPDQKTDGPYKTRRFLASGGESTNLRKFLERDMLDDICN